MIQLMAINNREIAGGNSCYEVVSQLRSVAAETGSERDRRFDVTLLVNGLPMIQIELKNSDHPFMDAFRQIRKYAEEGQFRGLMGLVQMYVVTNGVQTRYIAADNRGRLSERFLTRWVDKKNEVVENYLAFARAVLNIPAAHRMVGPYSVLDNESRRVSLLRPYQIHAVEAIRQASRARQSGFVWHTTGSGKTLTSYTVTKNLLDIPGVDKTIFLIDRKDLDQQTSTAFRSYADSDDIAIQNTERTADLEEKLDNDDRTTIVTTIQKLQLVIRRCTDATATGRYRSLATRIAPKSIAFVVDECHRAVTPETKRMIERFFGKSLWYGFTGTPIFAENRRAQKGDLAQTTQDLYGDCLHQYTIKEAIADHAVLGFHIQSMGHSLDSFRELAVALECYDEASVGDIPAATLERDVINAFNRSSPSGFYDSDDHRNRVIDYIVNRCHQKLRLNAPDGQAYEGLLTVPSIEIAQRYYRLFKQFVADGGVSEKIRQLLPDFPKVAITYTVGENEDGARADQQEMNKALQDYNAMFETNWDLSTLDAYNRELNERLARKQSKYWNRDQQLDIVIVVDRLLTGFDAPCLSVVFLDRPPMKPQHLVQAFSRTNRLFDKTKRYGQIITMQTPALYEKRIDEALLLYSQGGTSDVAAPPWEITRKKTIEAIRHLRMIVKKPDDVLRLSNTDEIRAFIKAFQAVDSLLGECQVYDDFQEEDLESVFRISREEMDALTGHYQNALETIRKQTDTQTGPDPVDIEYELESVKQVEINYRYLIALIQSHMPADQEKVPVISHAEDERIMRYIASYKRSNLQIGNLLEQVWLDLKTNPENFRGQDAHTVIEKRIDTVIDRRIADFAAQWCVNSAELKAYSLTTPSSDVVPEKINTDMGNFRAYKAAGGTGTKLTYLQNLRTAVVELVNREIKPLLKF